MVITLVLCLTDGRIHSKKHVDGLILTLGCFTFAIDSIKGESEHDGLAVSLGIELILTKLEAVYDVNSEGWWPRITINYYCSDDASQQAELDASWRDDSRTLFGYADMPTK